MKKRTYPLLAFLTLTVVAMACVLPFGRSEAPSNNQDQVATVVAMTMQALTPVNNAGPTPEPEPAGLLPHSLYYLSNGSGNGGVLQVFRMEKDGKTTHQITSEPTEVGNYGVSPVDGSVAYVVNNQLVIINADGSGRRVLVDGGAVDENNPFVARISHPVFSPDGQTLAYGYQGLNLYSLSTATNNLVIQNQIDDSGGGFLFPKELYFPDKFSPDGRKLLVTLGYYEGASSAFLDRQSNALTRLSGGEGALICCDQTKWSADSQSIYSANSAMGMFNAGLWRVDAATGDVTTLISSDLTSSVFRYAGDPYLAPDGQLYYFFLEADMEYNMRTPLKLVRSAPDGVTGRTVVLDEPFDMMNEALWAPDASFVLTADAPIQDVHQGGLVAINYLDGRPDVWLVDYALQMRWGP